MSGIGEDKPTRQPSLSTRYTAALDAARRVAAARYGGWSVVDREDLVSEVI